MPYSDPDKQREYQRKWMNKKNRSQGVPARRKGPDPDKYPIYKHGYRYGELKHAHRVLIELELALGKNQYSVRKKQ